MQHPRGCLQSSLTITKPPDLEISLLQPLRSAHMHARYRPAVHAMISPELHAAPIQEGACGALLLQANLPGLYPLPSWRYRARNRSTRHTCAVPPCCARHIAGTACSIPAGRCRPPRGSLRRTLTLAKPIGAAPAAVLEISLPQRLCSAHMRGTALMGTPYRRNCMQHPRGAMQPSKREPSEHSYTSQTHRGCTRCRPS